MTEKTEKSDAISAAKAIMGDGSLKSCERSRENGCRQCCQEGAFLFDGEVLDKVPAEVTITGQRVTNCLGKNGCRFKPHKKPLICLISPAISPVLYEDGLVTAEITLPSFTRCPATISQTFHEKVFRATSVLMEKGLWHPLSGSILTKIPLEEVALFRNKNR